MTRMTEDNLRSMRAGLERAEDAARDTVTAAAEAATDGVDQARAFLERNARERPLATIGVAAGVGFVLALLLSGGRRG